MSQQPINRSPDLRRLRDDGFDVEIRKSGHLLVKNVPCLNDRHAVVRGTLVTELTLASGDVAAPPGNHVAYWIGECPHDERGAPLRQINQRARVPLASDLTADLTISSHPVSGPYVDYFHKISTYVAMISGPAQMVDPSATAQTFPTIPSDDPQSVFEYLDSATSRAGIGVASGTLASQKVAIIGLGGTGSYVLDLVAKCPVEAIHLFDGDRFLQHNAFRSPGAAALAEISTPVTKAAYFKAQYSRMHRVIHAHEYAVDRSNVDQLRDLTFVFVCIDAPSAKPAIIEALESFCIPFVDVGMDVLIEDGSLCGVMRVTTSTPKHRVHFRRRVSLCDSSDGAYRQNIQIADLNALNAALAVIKWKKLCGFYVDLERELHTTYTLDGNTISNEPE